jgi:hypothetical protein
LKRGFQTEVELIDGNNLILKLKLLELTIIKFVMESDFRSFTVVDDTTNFSLLMSILVLGFEGGC